VAELGQRLELPAAGRALLQVATLSVVGKVLL